MKRLLVILLVLFLLTGCVTQPVETTQQTESSATEELVESRAPGEQLEEYFNSIREQTNGAVKAYRTENNAACNGVLPLGDRMVFFYKDEIVTYVEEYLYREDSVREVGDLLPQTHMVQVTDTRIAYYLEESRTFVLRDFSLAEVAREELSADIQGYPVYDEGSNTVYYCTAEGIRALNLDSGIARLLRQQTNYWQELTQSAFDGQMLVCSISDQDDMESTMYIMADTGMQIDDDACVHDLYTYGEDYFLVRWADAQPEYLFGQRGGEPMCFLPDGQPQQVVPALELGGVVTASTTEDGVALCFYDLDSGRKTAAVTLPDFTEVRGIVADQRGYIWFLAVDPETGLNRVYQWTVQKSPAKDDTVYTSPRYTEESPDTEGLAACEARAQTMGETYGIQLRIWEDAVAAPWENMKAEYRVASFQSALDELDGIFSQFPEGFLAQLGEICKSGAVTISLVQDAGSETTAHQQWLSGNAYVAVELGDEMQEQLYYWLYRVIDTYVLNHSSKIDEWNAEHPVDDRSELFTAAMTSGNEELFASDSLQSKLLQLCKAIRDAFELEKFESALPWEQYLNTPLY